MWSIRENLSLLLDHGHTVAWTYPLGMVADESAIIVKRDNARIASEAIALRSAGISIMSGKSETFEQLIDGLMGA